jgi:uncharacterized protein YndB with AHSA1/START domain
MEHVEVTHDFKALPEEVWQVYTDHARWREWAGTPGSRLVREGNEERNGSGAVRAFAGGMREEILDFEPPRRMTYAIRAGFFPIRDHQGEVRLERMPSGTRVTWTCRFEPIIPGTGALLRWFIQNMFARSLAGLERHSFS